MLENGEILMVLITSEFLLGVLLNGFIVVVNCTDWIRHKKLLTSDLILVGLAISRIGLLCTMMWTAYLFVNGLYAVIADRVRVIDVFLVLTHSSSIWFATVLSIFYFLKIANFSNPFFLWMKWRINRIIYMLLGGPLVISFAFCFPMMERMYYYADHFSRERERNVSQEVQENKNKLIMFQILFTLLGLIPFALTLVSLSLFILSLWRHTQQMQLNATGSRDPNTEAHVRAMKTMSSFLILFLLYHIGFLLNYWTYLLGTSKMFSLLNISIMFLYPFGHSLILILWNSKLRKAVLKLWWKIRCYQQGSHPQVLWTIWHFLRGLKSRWSP
ncbi:bitter taste receptor Modo-T2R23 [Monodelphis domestica]|uniref:Taste receptor type 2 n=1 Tax=Monodelphis domestica TaxID=13616 RepID=Q2AB96_MONDO|nr:bitter taste receptor Modo-T2R23 [Monodelphis domestica]BAE80371.1 bitter taste receptor [Monodelphis domestica]